MQRVSDRSIAASIAIEQLPKIVRQSLLKDGEFTTEYEIFTDSEIHLGGQGAGFSRNLFFEALKRLFANKDSSVKLDDIEGNEWRIEDFDEISGTFRFKSGEKSYGIESHWPLIEDRERRLARLAAEASEEEWTIDFKTKWQDVISDDALDAEQTFEFLGDREKLPYRVKRRIERLLKDGRGAWSDFVPSDSHYFEGEFGPISGSTTPDEFAQSEFRDHCQTLAVGNPEKGLRQSFNLCWHQSFVRHLAHGELDQDAIERALVKVAEVGNLLSKLSAIEFGLLCLDKNSSLDEVIDQLISSVLSEKPTDTEGRFCLLTACILLTGGLMSQMKTLYGYPLFYRRYAELAHAAILEGLVWESSQRKSSFFKQVISEFRQRYLAQGYVDLIEAPRWIPEFVTPEKLKAEFVSRIRIALETHRDVAQRSKLSKFFDPQSGGALVEHASFPSSYLPGPLEGGSESVTALPDDWAEKIHEALDSDSVDVGSFTLLINTSLVFKPNKDHIDLAAKAIAKANYQLKLKDKSSYLSLLHGLAHLAAITKSAELSDNTLVLLKRTINLGLESIAPNDAVEVACLLAAAKSNEDAWAEDLGHVFLWLAHRV
ncbi:MAG: hypothetical protein AAF636_16130, partial [Pseudomonadota bacterium]